MLMIFVGIQLILRISHIEDLYTESNAALTLVLPKGVVTTPLTVCLQPHKNANESDPGHLGHLFYILCGHFDEKKNGIPPKMGVG